MKNLFLTLAAACIAASCLAQTASQRSEPPSDTLEFTKVFDYVFKDGDPLPLADGTPDPLRSIDSVSTTLWIWACRDPEDTKQDCLYLHQNGLLFAIYRNGTILPGGNGPELSPEAALAILDETTATIVRWVK